MAEGAEKTEPATPKRRGEARKRGDVAQSREVATVMILMVATAGMMSPIGANLGRTLALQTRAVWSGQILAPGTMADYHAVLLHAGAVMGLALAPFLLLFVVAAIVSNLAQVGLMFSMEALQPKFGKLNPIKGFKRFVSPERLFDLVKSLLKVGAVVFLAWVVMEPSIEPVMLLVGAHPVETGKLMGELAVILIWLILIALAVFAAIDVVWTRYRYEKKLKMTKNEVRDETKQREGDPKVRSRIRQVQREAAIQRMISDLKSADVVITNPTHYAVALVYRPGESASPKVVAKGRNHLALRIRKIARESGIPIVENKPLAQLLYKTVDLGREIPASLFQAVAEVLATVYRMNPTRSAGWRSAS